ncbi:MAG: BufA1 family periplasmic bufferin-type metallophore [Burkholderiales bacterium]
MDQKTLVAAAVAGLFALGAGSAAFAADPQEKCWGVSKAGQNDCGSEKTGHSCAGQSKVDYNPNDFKAVKVGTCTTMGGSLTQGEPGRLAKDHMMKKG